MPRDALAACGHVLKAMDDEEIRQRRMIIGCAFSCAMIAAPFIALLYGLEFGLAVMAMALGATAWFAYSAAREETGVRARKLRLLAAANAGLCALVIVVLAGMLVA